MVERIDIVVSERGSRTVKRNLEDLATTADRAGDETAELQRRLQALSPTAELAQTMRQMQSLRQTMSQTGAASDWPRRPIAEANAELFQAIRRMDTLKSNMREQTPWGAVGRFEAGNLALAETQRRLAALQVQMARNAGPTSNFAPGSMDRLQGFTMSPLADSTGAFARNGRNAVGVANDLADGMDRVRTSAGGAGRPVMLLNRYIGAFGSLVAAQELMRLADSATVVTNRVNIVADSVEDATRGLDALYSIARNTRTPVEEMASLYQKAMLASDELGVSQQEVLQFVEAVGMGIAIQGSSANTARGALIQLSQAIGTDIVRAEEFNSILEGAFPIAQAAARGIDEASGSVARLRRMVIEGEVSSEQFFNAIMSQYPEIAGMFARTEPTISQAFTVLRNEVTQYISSSEEAQAISSGLAEAIILVADNIEPLADVLFALGVAWTVGFTVSTVSRIAAMAGSVGLLRTGLAAIAPLVGATGPVGVGLALIAGGAFLAYQNIETTAEKVENLRAVMDEGVTALDRYNTAVQTASDEQAELGGVLNLTTEAMLRQSRAELQDALRELSGEIADMEQEIDGTGLNIFNLDNIRAAKGELFGIFDPSGSNRADNLVFPNGELETLYDALEGIENGTGTIEDFVSAIERVRGVGPEVAAATDDLATALSALPDDLTGQASEQAQLWLQQAEEQLAGIAAAIGGFEAEIEAAANAQSLPEKVEALEALQQGLEAAAVAGNLVRNSSWISDTADLLGALQDARDLEQTMLEALGANAERLNELATEAEQFRLPLSGAADASSSTQATLEEINFVPLESGARGFADQLVRAAVAMREIGSIQVTPPTVNTDPIMANYATGPGGVTRASTGGMGLVELNNGGSFQVGGNGGIDQNLVAFWASRGETVTVTPNNAANSDIMAGANRQGQNEEYLDFLRDVNTELDERYQRVTELNDALGAEADVQEILRNARQQGIILSEADVNLIRQRTEALTELEAQAELVDNVAGALFNNMSGALDEFVQTGTVDIKAFARSVIADLSQIGLQTFLMNPIQGFLGNFASNIAGGLFGGAATPELPGFNEGADFMVGGTGGVDKNVVAFKASRGERVQVTPAGQSAGSGASNNVTFNITTPDAESFRRSETQMAARAQQMMARGQRNA